MLPIERFVEKFLEELHEDFIELVHNSVMKWSEILSNWCIVGGVQ